MDLNNPLLGQQHWHFDFKKSTLSPTFELSKPCKYNTFFITFISISLIYERGVTKPPLLFLLFCDPLTKSKRTSQTQRFQVLIAGNTAVVLGKSGK
jgi:hypothetical protein